MAMLYGTLVGLQGTVLDFSPSTDGHMIWQFLISLFAKTTLTDQYSFAHGKDQRELGLAVSI
jgi:hypothetical protein